MANLPPSWTIAKLGDLSVIIHYGYTAKSSLDIDGIKYLRITDIQNNLINWNDVPYCVISEEELGNYQLESGDIVFARSGATVGKTICLNEFIPKSIFASYLIRIKLKKHISEKFIHYYFQTPRYWKQIKEGQIGIGQPNFNGTKLANLKVIIPPLPEQHRIVSKLEELFSSLDSAVAALRKAKEQVKTYKQAVLKYAFEGKLRIDNSQLTINEETGLPDSMQNVECKMNNEERKKVTIGDVAKVNPRLNVIPKDDTEVSFLPMKLVEAGNGIFHLTDNRKYSEVKKGFTQFQNDDVIFAKITPCMENGKIAVMNGLVNGIGCGSTEFHVIRVDKLKVIPKSMFYYVLQESYRKEARNNMKGTAGQLRVPADFILHSTFYIFHLEKQEQIVAEIEIRFSEAENLEKTIDLSLKQAESLRQSILKKAFEGRLVPQDPEDEPASLLLERIKKLKIMNYEL